MIYDPDREGGRSLDGVAVLPELSPDAGDGSTASIASRKRALDRVMARAASGSVFCIASESLPAEGKLRGIDPGLLEALAPAFDWLLVEADGSRRLPVKAPGSTEPVMPSGTDLVLGCVGLDCLGTPIAAGTVHRHDLFARLAGAAPGEAITAAHLAALAAAKDGLFKAAPPSARRVVALNKADLLPAGRLGAVLDAFDGVSAQGVDLVAACRFAAPFDRVVAARRVAPRPDAPVVE
jgi:probable selenium-dependent hydroxylase accessory protein YqeC